MSDEPVKVQYEGVCEEISEKNGWTTFAINVGRQYPVRLSTKLPALIEQGRAAGDQRAVWSAKESQGGENPNKPGTHYTNRYLDGVVVGVLPNDPHDPSQVPRPSISSPTHTPYAQGDKDRAITRMAVLKAAAEVCASVDYAPGEDIGSEVIALAHRFEVWVNRDIDEVPFG